MTENPDTPEIDDPEVPQPRVRLRVVLALLRILAGSRGHSRVRWSGQGFVYTLAVRRDDPEPITFDSDPTAPGRSAAIEMLRDHLTDEG